jgi:hypothetical protein
MPVEGSDWKIGSSLEGGVRGVAVVVGGGGGGDSEALSGLNWGRVLDRGGEDILGVSMVGLYEGFLAFGGLDS